MAKIKAPFNFVPLSDKVLLPEWAGQISHDVPFSDARSGELELTITACSPLLVGDGPNKEADGSRHVHFTHTPDGRVFIPGSTLKGAIRAVLEIMSNGKMTRVANTSFSVRDLNDTKYRNNLKGIHCGWMSKDTDDDRYHISDCGEPYRIDAKEIDKIFPTAHLSHFIARRENFKTDDNKTAQRKYELVGVSDFTKRGTTLDRTFSRSGDDSGRRLVKCDPDGDIAGTIVFTGQPGYRDDAARKGKHLEFVFGHPTATHDVSADVARAFETIHAESPDYFTPAARGGWKYWKQVLQDGGEIPVFFRVEGGNSVHSIGIAYMYRFPASTDVDKAISNKSPRLKCADPDLAECIFGYATNERSLKGRVQFGHAFLTEPAAEQTVEKFVQATPHASYYPLYLGNGLKWDDSNDKVTIAGRKRYPVRDGLLPNNVGNDAMAVTIHPLPKGVRLVGKVRYHNLRRCELGALLAAITFLGRDDCYHSLGMGKALGYGKVKIDITATPQGVDVGDLIDDFRTLMTTQIGNNWESGEPIKELLAMAHGIPAGMNDEFSYLTMDQNNRVNEFVDGRKAYNNGGEGLKRFSEIAGRDPQMSAWLGEWITGIGKKERERLLRQTEAIICDHIDHKRFAEAEALLAKNDDPIFDKQRQRLNDIIAKTEQLATEAKRLESGSIADMERAVELYKQASSIGYRDFTAQIESLESKIATARARENETILEFLANLRLASPAAFFGRNQLGRFPIDDVEAHAEAIADKIKADVRQRDLPRWCRDGRRQCAKTFSEGVANHIFDKVENA